MKSSGWSRKMFTVEYNFNIGCTCNSCNTDMSALPDMYKWCPRACSTRGWIADISGNAQVPVLQLPCYTSGTLKICPNLLLTALPIYIAKDSHCDYSILILTFPWRLFIQYILLVSIMEGYLMLMSKCLTNFTEQERLQWYT